MAMKKDIKTWAIKIRGRSFYLRSNVHPGHLLTRKTLMIFVKACLTDMKFLLNQ
jgi:hypothetical protein